MNYIQNELLRQARAFAVLLGVETDGDSGAEADPDGKNFGLQESWTTSLQRHSEINARSAAVALGLGGSDEAPMANSIAGTTLPPQPGHSGITVNGFFSDSGDTGADAAQVLLVQDQGLNAGELSRIFERDARRYNGAYPLY